MHRVWNDVHMSRVNSLFIERQKFCASQQTEIPIMFKWLLSMVIKRIVWLWAEYMHTNAFKTTWFCFPKSPISLSCWRSSSVSLLMISMMESSVPVLNFAPPGFMTATLMIIKHLKAIGQVYSHGIQRWVKNSAAIFNKGSKLTFWESNLRNNTPKDSSIDTKSPSDFRLWQMKVSVQ